MGVLDTILIVAVVIGGGYFAWTQRCNIYPPMCKQENLEASTHRDSGAPDPKKTPFCDAPNANEPGSLCQQAKQAALKKGIVSDVKAFNSSSSSYVMSTMMGTDLIPGKRMSFN